MDILIQPPLASCSSSPASSSANCIKNSICSENGPAFCAALYVAVWLCLGFPNQNGKKEAALNNKPIVHFKSMVCSAFTEISPNARKAR